MVCSFKRMVYPKVVAAIDDGGYMIAIYNIHEKTTDSNGIPITEVKVVGYHLPTVVGMKVDLNGRWAKNKHGMQYEVDSYNEVIAQTESSITAYLSSGLIKGVGPEIANRIYKTFGDETLAIMDTQPEKLLTVPGIAKVKLEQIRDSYLATRCVRDIVALMRPHGITANRAMKIYEHFGNDSIHIVREHPYRLCEMTGIGFETADNIATAMGLDPFSSDRVAAGLIHTLKEAESVGNLCLPIKKFRQSAVKILHTDGIDEKRIGDEAYRLLQAGKLKLYQEQVYRSITARIEQEVADALKKLTEHGKIPYRRDIELDLDREERALGLSLAPEQREAIKTCLTSQICIVSGGPGTGKTLIQKVLLALYQRANPKAEVVCCAPTGRAARHMADCTGYPASTIHRALGLLAGDDGEYSSPKPLEADLVLIDEVSMLDIYLANHLLSALPDDCRLILVGDADQLPSVGPGAVLSEMIACGQIPVVKLDKVFRQNAGSRIATNAMLIRHNNLALEYGDDFAFYESATCEQSAEIIEALYLREAERIGVDNVALLTPFRQKTDTGANALNERLREKINPPASDKPEIAIGNRVFRLGDKVMQVKNREDINNGDIGYVTRIDRNGDAPMAYVDYGDGRFSSYDASELGLLDLAYACTVHKSQGSEYATVIVNIQKGHSIMLKRPLVYTAITRAKQKVLIVGERQAICIAIRTVDAEKRGTMLAARINAVTDMLACNQ